MNDDIRAQFDAAFQKQVDEKAKAEAIQKDATVARQNFLNDFIRAQEEIIRPAMQEVGEYLQTKGLQFTISTTEERILQRGESQDASIKIVFYRGASADARGNNPHLSATCVSRDKIVRFHESTLWPTGGGHTGPAGNHPLIDITADLIQKKIVKIIEKAIR